MGHSVQWFRLFAEFSLSQGNHECREIQLNFTFHKECVSKFGEELGEEVWEAVNKVKKDMALQILLIY